LILFEDASFKLAYQETDNGIKMDTGLKYWPRHD